MLRTSAALLCIVALAAAPARAQPQVNPADGQAAGTAMVYHYFVTMQQVFDACFGTETELRRDFGETLALVEQIIVRTTAITADQLDVVKRRILAQPGTPAEVQAACRGEGPSPLRPFIQQLQAQIAANAEQMRRDTARGRDEMRERLDRLIETPRQPALSP
jgi:hypothetical protein